MRTHENSFIFFLVPGLTGPNYGTRAKIRRTELLYLRKKRKKQVKKQIMPRKRGKCDLVPEKSPEPEKLDHPKSKLELASQGPISFESKHLHDEFDKLMSIICDSKFTFMVDNGQLTLTIPRREVYRCDPVENTKEYTIFRCYLGQAAWEIGRTAIHEISTLFQIANISGLGCYTMVHIIVHSEEGMGKAGTWHVDNKSVRKGVYLTISFPMVESTDKHPSEFTTAFGTEDKVHHLPHQEGAKTVAVWGPHVQHRGDAYNFSAVKKEFKINPKKVNGKQVSVRLFLVVTGVKDPNIPPEAGCVRGDMLNSYKRKRGCGLHP